MTTLLPLTRIESLIAEAAARERVGVSKFLGVNLARSLFRARDAGGLSPNVADALAVKVGLHPASVWPDSWWQTF